MTRQQRVTRVLVELADTLVVGFDVIDFLHTLVERSVELVRASDGPMRFTTRRGMRRSCRTSASCRSAIRRIWAFRVS